MKDKSIEKRKDLKMILSLIEQNHEEIDIIYFFLPKQSGFILLIFIVTSPVFIFVFPASLQLKEILNSFWPSLDAAR